MEQAVNVRADRFRQYAPQHVSRAMRAIQRIGNLSRTSRYDYSAEQVEKIFKTLRDQLDAAEKRFLPTQTNFTWED